MDASAISKRTSTYSHFYSTTFRNEAQSTFQKRGIHMWGLLFSALLLFAIACTVPYFINPTSIFSKILMGMGEAVLIGALYSLNRLLTIKKRCEQNLDELLRSEFESSASENKRIFTAAFFENRVVLSAGTKTALERTREKKYEEISAIYETDELFFIKGFNWFSKFLLSDECIEQIRILLKEKCSDRFVEVETREI